MAIKVATPNPGGVRTQHDDYCELANYWQKARDVSSGEDAVKTAGKSYVPSLTEQNEVDYKAMLMRGSFYNATARTISGLIGMIFRKPPVIEKPTAIEDLLKDVDMSGKPLDSFASEIVDECLTVGRVGVLIDHTVKPLDQAPITIAKASALNLRPFMKIYVAENIINWKFKVINKVWTLCQVVLAEKKVVPKLDPKTNKPSEFENESQNRWRVLDLMDDLFYRVRVFYIDEQGNDAVESEEIPEMNGQPLPFIPFIMMNECGMSFDPEKPPLLDLVNLNLSHWRTSVDYEHGAHFTALPTLFLSGYNPPAPANGEGPTKIMLGSQSAIVATDVGAQANFIEFTGQGLGALEASLDRKEQQMAILGARMLATEGKQAQTATTTAIHRTGENSVLSSIAIAISLGLTKALQWFSQWAGYEDDCDYELNRDFLPATVDGPTLTAILQAYQQGAISEEELFDWLKRGDIIEAEVSIEDHKAGTFVPQLDPTADPANPKAIKKPVGDPPIEKNPIVK